MRFLNLPLLFHDGGSLGVGLSAAPASFALSRTARRRAFFASRTCSQCDTGGGVRERAFAVAPWLEHQSLFVRRPPSGGQYKYRHGGPEGSLERSVRRRIGQLRASDRVKGFR